MFQSLPLRLAAAFVAAASLGPTFRAPAVASDDPPDKPTASPLAGLPLGDATPRAMRAPAGLTREDAALQFLAQRHPWLAAGDLRVIESRPLGKGHLVLMRQSFRGIPVHPSRLSAIFGPAGELVALRGEPEPPPLELRSPRQRGADAIALALTELWMTPFDAAMLDQTGDDEGGTRSFALAPGADLTTGIVFRADARARLVLTPTDEGLRLAHEVEVDTEVPGDTAFLAWAFLIDAGTGAILLRRDLVSDAEMRLWVDDDARPMAGPHEDFHPHPTGTPDGSVPAFTMPALTPLIPFGSGNDPWLADNATTTTGNHVDAYLDLASPNGFGDGDLRPTVTAPGVFDYVYDTDRTAAADENQLAASVLPLFFVTNWMHDWYYDSGFNERAGNAQRDNYGRGGVQLDPILAEGQDYALSQNASMTTPGDGGSPRLQAGNWPEPTRAFVELAKNRLAPAGVATFGPQNFDITAPIIQAVDNGGSSTTDGCDAYANDVSGAIALVDRGTCNFSDKAARAFAAGAVGVLIANVSAGAPPSLSGSAVDLPTLSITLEHATALRALIADGATDGRMARLPPMVRAGTLDATIIAHEWMHYMHLRSVYCASLQCFAESEGWADFAALHMLFEPGDDPLGTYAVGVYSTPSVSQDPGYFGIRRFPYSARLDRNPLTFRHIQQSASIPNTAPRNAFAGGGNNVPHRAGEVWSSMLWQAYMALHGDEGDDGNPRLSYTDARRRMSDYVVAGMQLAPADPTYTEQRDGILAAARVVDVDDWVALAEGFALRGAGSCAGSPPRQLSSLEGVTESFALAPDPVVTVIGLDDSEAGCDADGALDAGERGRLLLRIENAGPELLSGSTLALTPRIEGLSVEETMPIALPDIAPGESAELGVTVALASGLEGPVNVVADAVFTSPDLCGEGTTARVIDVYTNDRVVEGASDTEGFEASTTGWTSVGTRGIWERVLLAPGVHVVRGLDRDRPSNARLVSPPLTVGSGPLTVSWRHAWRFEHTTGTTPAYYDGGIVEVSLDNGATWRDLSSYTTVPYPGRIVQNSTNALSNRLAFVGESPDYPTLQPIVFELGEAFAGRTIRFGWRVASDMYAGDEGWYLDDIRFDGLETAPFAARVADPAPAFFRDGDGDGVGAGDAVPVCPLVDGWVSVGGDCDDDDDAAFPGAPERCDGADNDCNGDTDEGFELGGACERGDGACRAEGTVVCLADGTAGCDAVAGTPSNETCNSMDDDCDGDTDEGFDIGGACVSGAGACARAGLLRCDEAGGLSCDAVAGAPQDEACNGVDDDCDGDTDEGFDVGAACEAGAGACRREGTWICNQDGSIACSVMAGTPAVEVCNGIDDDCDGDTDEGFGLGAACTSGTGACAASGEIVCGADGNAACSAVGLDASAETCNAVDDDCDGETDEGFDVGEGCEVGAGACRRTGTWICNDDGGAACSAVAGEPGEERCNGVDDDCDGDTDEGFDLGSACESGVGACRGEGVWKCDDSGGAACSAVAGAPRDESCNGEDDDCDGETDEGFDLGGACEEGVGTCRSAGVFVCGPEGVTCSAVARSPSTETCDGRDEDCDGETDEDFGLGEACAVGVGACAREGTTVCDNLGGTRCSVTAGAPRDETCNETDDDCDGETDEGDVCADPEPSPEPAPEPSPEPGPEEEPDAEPGPEPSPEAAADDAAATPDARPAGADTNAGTVVNGTASGCAGGESGAPWLALMLALVARFGSARRRSRGGA